MEFERILWRRNGVERVRGGKDCGNDRFHVLYRCSVSSHSRLKDTSRSRDLFKEHELEILTSASPTIKTKILPPFGKVCAKSPNLTPGFPFTGTTLMSSKSSVLNL